jgi:hypothetical protein
LWTRKAASRKAAAISSAKRWFRLQGCHDTLAGKGLILGNDDEGCERSTRYRAADIAPLITFLDAVIYPDHLTETTTPWPFSQVLGHTFPLPRRGK